MNCLFQFRLAYVEHNGSNRALNFRECITSMMKMATFPCKFFPQLLLGGNGNGQLLINRWIVADRADSIF